MYVFQSIYVLVSILIDRQYLYLCPFYYFLFTYVSINTYLGVSISTLSSVPRPLVPSSPSARSAAGFWRGRETRRAGRVEDSVMLLMDKYSGIAFRLSLVLFFSLLFSLCFSFFVFLSFPPFFNLFYLHRSVCLSVRPTSTPSFLLPTSLSLPHHCSSSIRRQSPGLSDYIWLSSLREYSFMRQLLLGRVFGTDLPKRVSERADTFLPFL